MQKSRLPLSVTGYELMRHRVVRLLESIQDLIVVSLCIGLFSFMVMQLQEMFQSLWPPLDFQPVTADILFLLILVELFRLLIIYLPEQRVSIGVAVEVLIVSILREVIVRGVLETPASQIWSACAFLLVLGGLLVIRVWLPLMFEGGHPEHLVSARRKKELIHTEAPDEELNLPIAPFSESYLQQNQCLVLPVVDELRSCFPLEGGWYTLSPWRKVEGNILLNSGS